MFSVFGGIVVHAADAVTEALFVASDVQFIPFAVAAFAVSSVKSKKLGFKSLSFFFHLILGAISLVCVVGLIVAVYHTLISLMVS